MNQVLIQVNKSEKKESNIGSDTESVVLSVASLDSITQNADFVHL